jgi:hypothetical protein
MKKPPGKESLGEEEASRWLDTITYETYLEHYLNLHPEITSFVSPLVACVLGLGANAISSYRVAGPRLLGLQPFFPKP